MALYLAHQDDKKIVLKRPRYGCVNLIPLVFGLIVFAIGMFFSIRTFGDELQLFFFSSMVAGIGLLGIIMGGALLPWHHKRDPEYILFDHTQGIIEVRMNSKLAAQIPYSEILGFESYPLKSHDPDYPTTWALYLKKKNGSEWELISLPGKESDLLTFFKNALNHAKTSSTFLKTKVPANFKEVSNEAQSLISWRNRSSPAIMFVLVFTLMFTVVTIKGLYDIKSFPLLLDYIMLPFTFIIASIAMVYVVYRLFINLTDRNAVLIDQSHFEFFKFSILSGKQRMKMSVPLTEIAEVVYHYKASYAFSLELISPGELSYIKQHATNPLQQWKEILPKGRKAIKIPIDEISLAEGMIVESWIREKLNKHVKQG